MMRVVWLADKSWWACDRGLKDISARAQACLERRRTLRPLTSAPSCSLVSVSRLVCLPRSPSVCFHKIATLRS